MSLFLPNNYPGDKIKKEEMGRACGMYEGEVRCLDGVN